MMATGRVLVTGGAGYIGSHTILALREAGRSVVVIDDLSTGTRAAVAADVPFVEGDVGDRDLVRRTLREHAISAVLHFAGSIVVPESVSDPLKYYRNNTAAARTLIEACVAEDIGTFIFSSTAAVYGEPAEIPVSEDVERAPTNPYGRSKLAVEWILEDVGRAHGLRWVALRYFNVAGADPAGRVGQSTPQSTHLIKIASQVAIGRRPFIEVFGDDYATPDGTCVRDYIHVSDLAEAHVEALAYLDGGGASCSVNCGYGHGFSVLDVLRCVVEVAGHELDVRRAPRRPGDPPELVADTRRIRSRLDWTPRRDDLRLIVRSAMDWERTLARRDACEDAT